MPKNTAYHAGRLGYVPESQGVIFNGYFESVEGCYPAVRFTYRPCTQVERVRLLASLETLRQHKQEEKIAEILATQIKSWDLEKAPDKPEDKFAPLPVTAVSAARLVQPLYRRFAGLIVYGSDVSDPDPDWKKEDADEADEADVKAILTGTAPVDAAVEVREGNSAAG